MEMIFIIVSLFVIVGLIYLSGWFSGTETALTHLSKAQIAEMRRKGERNIEFIITLKKDMDRTLVMLLIGNNIVNIVLSTFAALLANALFHTIGVTVMVGLLTFFIIVFGEITPKSKAIINTEEVSKKNARRLYYLARIFAPLISLFIGISRRIIKLGGGRTRKKSLLVSDESIKSLATLGEQEGVIKGIERDIIHKVFRFGDVKVKNVMVPFKDVFYLRSDVSIPRAMAIVKKRGFTRVPLVGRSGSIEGVLYVKDLLGERHGSISAVARKPFFISPEMDVTDLFTSMLKKRIHMAIVSSETGPPIGIVTLEDIIEELVGEIHDEYFDRKFGKDSKTDPSSIPGATG